MDLTRFLTVFVVLCLEGGETGGHGEKHHDHVKLHIPEFIHHDHHTKVITVHHHHHKPKKEHHHHHHHHHHKKPQIPFGHHYHHHHKKAHTTTHTVSKGHAHGHKGLHSVDKGHKGHQGYHGQGHHHSPSYSYDPPSVPSYEDFGQTFVPSVPSYSSGIEHQTPRVHGVTHTVKQVKVFDSLPGVLPTNTGSQGYEVTEQGEEDDDDVFTSVNSLQQTYPMTYGYVRGLTAPSDSLAQLTPQHAVQSHDPFAAVAQPTASFAGETFTGDTFTGDTYSSGPIEFSGISGQTSAEFPVTFPDSDGNQVESFAGVGRDNEAFITNDETLSAEVPLTFAREAGIQQTTNTRDVETIEY